MPDIRKTAEESRILERRAISEGIPGKFETALQPQYQFGSDHHKNLETIRVQLQKKVEDKLWHEDFMRFCYVRAGIMFPETLLGALEKHNVTKGLIETRKTDGKTVFTFTKKGFKPQDYHPKYYENCKFDVPGLYVCGKITAERTKHSVECVLVQPENPSTLVAPSLSQQGETMHILNRDSGSSAENSEPVAEGPEPISEKDYLSEEKIENVSWQDFASYSYALPTQTINNEPVINSKPPEQGDPGFSQLTQIEYMAIKAIVDPVCFHYYPTSLPWKKKFVDIHWDALKVAGVDKVLLGACRELALFPASRKALLLEIPVPEAHTLSYSERERLIFSVGYQDADTVINIMKAYDDDALFVAWLYGQDGVVEEEVEKEIVDHLTIKWSNLKEAIESRYRYYMNKAASRDVPMPVYPYSYPFELYEPYSYNLGLRLVYRQTWRQLGTQRGEVVRSIPLGPKQVERVTTKITNRFKSENAYEQSRFDEQTTDQSSNTKDSTAIIAEASKSFNFSTDITASVNIGVFSGKSNMGINTGVASNSKTTSSHLTDIMQKAATKTRRETKVQVKTESEFTSLEERFSEIRNPNEEIAVTYFYSNLQRQYEVLTRLAEVESVLFVAEEVPESDDDSITQWIRKYDWILARVLLDESFREGLSMICQDECGPERLDVTVKEKIDIVMDKVGTSLGELAKNQGAMSQMDVISEAQKAYRNVHEGEADKRRQRNLAWNGKRRFLDHVRENLLHYCRAVWSREDPEQRMLRYRKSGLMIPTVWKFQTGRPELRFDWGANSPAREGSIQDRFLVWDRSHSNPNFRLGQSFKEKVVFQAGWEPDLSDSSTLRPLADVINPAGHLGFSGNYSVYTVRGDLSSLSNGSDVFPMLHTMREPYSDENGLMKDPAMDLIEIGMEKRLDELSEEERMELVLSTPELTEVYENSTPNEARELVDNLPAWKNIRHYYCSNYCSKLGSDTKDSIIETIPSLSADYDKLNDSERLSFVSSLIITERLFREYLFIKENSRKLVVDTNNLVVDIIQGTGSTLERFKRKHREVDVLKAGEETRKLSLDNMRRAELIAKGNLQDPDIEKIIVLEADCCEGLRGIVGIRGGNGDDGGDD